MKNHLELVHSSTTLCDSLSHMSNKRDHWATHVDGDRRIPDTRSVPHHQQHHQHDSQYPGPAKMSQRASSRPYRRVLFVRHVCRGLRTDGTGCAVELPRNSNSMSGT
jgi:hypothetical protein